MLVTCPGLEHQLRHSSSGSTTGLNAPYGLAGCDSDQRGIARTKDMNGNNADVSDQAVEDFIRATGGGKGKYSDKHFNQVTHFSLR